MSGRRITNLTPTSSFNLGSRSTDSGVPNNSSNNSNNVSNSNNDNKDGGGILSPPSSTATLNSTNTAGSSPPPPPPSSQRRPFQTTARRRRRNNNDDKKDFNPRLISSQIIAMQCFHYVFLGLLFQINRLLYGTSITIDRIFTDNYIKVWDWKGLPDTFAVLLSSIVGAVLLAVIVEKSKKCLDFAVTLFIIHLGFCTCYNGFPKTWDWWIAHILGTIIMVLLGEYVCSLREMSDIPLLQI